MFLAIDPGKTNGWAVFDSGGIFQDYGQGDLDELREVFQEYEKTLQVVVIENFKLFKHKAVQQSGSDMVASRVIGAVEEWVRPRQIKLVKQDASILTIAQLWSGKKMPSVHSKSHWVSAYNHGYYYLVKAKIKKLKVRPE